MSFVVQAWVDASRPKTLPLACLAILTGSVLALTAGQFSWLVLLLSLLTACLLQVLSNLANDYGDGLRGVDNSERLGPVRALQSGALSQQQLRLSLFVVAALCMASGLTLIWAAQPGTTALLVFTLLGLLSIVAALTYTLGSKPYGYAGLGDLSVWLFFGWLAVLGSYYLHGATPDITLLLPASAFGCLAVAVLNVNNMRDIDNDILHGKRTLAARLGLHQAKLYHLALLTSALGLFFSYLLIAPLAGPLWLAALFIPALIPAYLHAHAIWQASSSPQMAPLLASMVGCTLLISGLFLLVLLVAVFFPQ